MPAPRGCFDNGKREGVESAHRTCQGLKANGQQPLFVSPQDRVALALPQSTTRCPACPQDTASRMGLGAARPTSGCQPPLLRVSNTSPGLHTLLLGVLAPWKQGVVGEPSRVSCRRTEAPS